MNNNKDKKKKPDLYPKPWPPCRYPALGEQFKTKWHILTGYI